MNAKRFVGMVLVLVVLLLCAVPVLAQEGEPVANATSPIAIVTMLAVVNKVIVDYIADPIRKHLNGTDMWWLLYVSLITGAALGWLSGANIFADVIPDALIMGRVLTALVVGGGSKIIHDVIDALPSA